MGQIQYIVCFCKLNFIWTQPHSFIDVLSMAGFARQWELSSGKAQPYGRELMDCKS